MLAALFIGIHFYLLKVLTALHHESKCVIAQCLIKGELILGTKLDVMAGIITYMLLGMLAAS